MDEVLLKPRSLIKVYFVNSQASARMYGNISVYFSLCIGMRQGCTLRQIVTSSSVFKYHLSSILDRYCVCVCVFVWPTHVVFLIKTHFVRKLLTLARMYPA